VVTTLLLLFNDVLIHYFVTTGAVGGTLYVTTLGFKKLLDNIRTWSAGTTGLTAIRFFCIAIGLDGR
jgi:hypothetical protein